MTSTHAFRPGTLVVWGLVGLSVTLAVLSVLTYARVRGLDNPAPLDAGRLREAEAARMALAARVEQLERERVRAEAEAARQADAARAASETSAALQRRLESAEAPRAPVEPSVVRPGGQVGRLLDSVDARRALEQLTILPGVELLRLAAVGPYLEARGHVLWHPARPDLVVCAFRLPALPDGIFYRVRLLGAGGAVDEAAAFRPASAGDIVLPVRMRDGVNALRAIEVVRDPDAAPVLRGEVPQARSAG